ncbi:TolC family protein [Magnetococcales bacterium HHB-1]
MNRKGTLLRRLSFPLIFALLTGCVLTPPPISKEQQLKIVQDDTKALFAKQPALTGPLTLHEAMARAIKYNLDHRMKLMEFELANRQLDLTYTELLPKLNASAGFEGRNNFAGSRSRSLTTGTQSLENSTSQDKSRDVWNFNLVWNLLDFGVSYVRAKQDADRVRIRDERRRKVIHNIIQDVRESYWKAYSASRLLERIDPMMKKVEQALDRARTIEKKRLQPPIKILTYRRTLLDILKQIKTLRRDLLTAKIQMASLMNLPPSIEFKLAAIDPQTIQDLEPLRFNPIDLEKTALVNRPELIEEFYQTRISAEEVKKAILNMLPGIDLNAGYQYDSNSYTFNRDWGTYSAKVVWNIFNLIKGPAQIKAAKAQQKLVNTRRLALSLAILTQVHVSGSRYHQAILEWYSARERFEVEKKIHKHAQASYRSGRNGTLPLIRAELSLLLAELQRDLAFNRLETTRGNIYVAAGVDPLPKTISSHDLKTVAGAIKDAFRHWDRKHQIRFSLSR